MLCALRTGLGVLPRDPRGARAGLPYSYTSTLAAAGLTPPFVRLPAQVLYWQRQVHLRGKQRPVPPNQAVLRGGRGWLRRRAASNMREQLRLQELLQETRHDVQH